MSLCSECVNSALNQAGVYCTEFGEQVVSEQIAAQCSEFEAMPRTEPRAVSRNVAIFDSNLRKKDPSAWVSPEQEQTVAWTVEMDFYGKEEHAEKLTSDLERKLATILGTRVRVKRVT